MLQGTGGGGRLVNFISLENRKRLRIKFRLTSEAAAAASSFYMFVYVVCKGNLNLHN